MHCQRGQGHLGPGEREASSQLLQSGNIRSGMGKTGAPLIRSSSSNSFANGKSLNVQQERERDGWLAGLAGWLCV